jgi:hypothetical protein
LSGPRRPVGGLQAPKVVGVEVAVDAEKHHLIGSPLREHRLGEGQRAERRPGAAVEHPRVRLETHARLGHETGEKLRGIGLCEARVGSEGLGRNEEQDPPRLGRASQRLLQRTKCHVRQPVGLGFPERPVRGDARDDLFGAERFGQQVEAQSRHRSAHRRAGLRRRQPGGRHRARAEDVERDPHAGSQTGSPLRVPSPPSGSM